jgi:uncharacterized protein
VIVVDANLLIYSYDSHSRDHAKSRAWVEQAFASSELIGLSWQTICAFLRVVTNRRLPGYRVPLDEAAQTVEAWLIHPNVQILVPGDQHWPILRKMILEGQASGPLVSDAELAALAIENGAVLYTADRDFARFPALRWKNPLVPGN